MAFVPKITTPKVNPARVYLMDADIITYDAAYNVEDEQVENMKRRIDLKLEANLQTAGCAAMECYLTGPNNFRTGLAKTKQYKGNRYYPDGTRKAPQPKHLGTARQYIMEAHAGIMSVWEEADDTISKRNWGICCGNDLKYDECVIGTTDKDIGINPGYYMNLMDDTIVLHKGFGELYVRNSGTPNAALKGWGMKFFLAQMLMGDPTDYIPGLPKVPLIAKEMCGVKRGGFGGMKAYACLCDVESYEKGIAIVMLFYQDYMAEFCPASKITTWQGEEIDYDWYDLLLEQGRLLWMRRAAGEMWTPALDYDRQEKLLWGNYKPTEI